MAPLDKAEQESMVEKWRATTEEEEMAPPVEARQLRNRELKALTGTDA
jgi:hypothetical protein